MPFKTLEEANEYEVKMEKQVAELKTAKQGAELKATDLTKQIEELTTETNRLKIKNYELFEQVTKPLKDGDTSSSNDEDEEGKDTTPSLDDLLKEF